MKAHVLEAFNAFVKAEAGWSLTPDNFEGVHVTCDGGWVLMRKSLHDPQIPINIESDKVGGVVLLEKKVRDFLSRFERLRLP